MKPCGGVLHTCPSHQDSVEGSEYIFIGKIKPLQPLYVAITKLVHKSVPFAGFSSFSTHGQFHEEKQV